MQSAASIRRVAREGICSVCSSKRDLWRVSSVRHHTSAVGGNILRMTRWVCSLCASKPFTPVMGTWISRENMDVDSRRQSSIPELLEERAKRAKRSKEKWCSLDRG